MAGRLEQPAGMLDGRHRLIGHRESQGRDREEGDPQSDRGRPHLLGEGPLGGGAFHQAYGSGALIASSTAAASATVRVERTLGRHALPTGDGRGHPAPAGLETDQPTARRGDPDRASPVAGMGHREHAGRHRGCRPTARSSRGVGRVPRIAGGAVAVVLGDVIDPNSGVLVRPVRMKPARTKASATGSLTVLGPSGAPRDP